MSTLAEGFQIIDADTHYTEPYDLWTSRAPKDLQNRVLHVEKVNGVDTWFAEGNEIGFARGGGVVAKDDSKIPFLESSDKGLDWVHDGAFEPQARLDMMDECGIHAQVLFPNVVGLGGSTLNNVIPDESLRMLCLEIYNDAMAEMQTDSKNRFIPMTLMPAWSVDRCVQETIRAHKLGLRGINMTSDPQDAGSPDLASRAWDPLWKVCSDLNMPVHFHIGSSNTAMDFFGKYFWPSQDEYVKPAIGGGLLFLNSARVVMNTIFSGVFDRFPDLTMVAVESGIGWVPFILETMDYEPSENAPEQYKAMKYKPSEYFAKNWYATFWFEEAQGDLQNLMDKVGDDRILFETDFPHPTCIYPAPLAHVDNAVSSLRPETQARVMGDNARTLYRL